MDATTFAEHGQDRTELRSLFDKTYFFRLLIAPVLMAACAAVVPRQCEAQNIDDLLTAAELAEFGPLIRAADKLDSEDPREVMAALRVYRDFDRQRQKLLKITCAKLIDHAGTKPTRGRRRAAEALVKYFPDYAAPSLVTWIDCYDPATQFIAQDEDLDSDFIQLRYPCVQGLVKLGGPSVSQILEHVNGVNSPLLSDECIYLFAYTLRCIRGWSAEENEELRKSVRDSADATEPSPNVRRLLVALGGVEKGKLPHNRRKNDAPVDLTVGGMGRAKGDATGVFSLIEFALNL